MKNLKKSIVALALAFVMAASYTATANAAVLGVDVSKYQGDIDWNAARSTASYTFIKVGSAKSGLDPKFAQNVMGAQAAGLRTGVYIYSYATSVEGAMMEAMMVLQWIEPYNINFPVAYDIEDAIQKGIDPGTFTAMCNAFCDVIATAGYTPIVYTNQNMFQRQVTPELRYDKWVARYNNAGVDIPDWAIWQFTSSGSVPGIAGNVDMNWMQKDYFNDIMGIGFSQKPDGMYFYNNYRKVRGWIDVNGGRYHFGDDFRMNTGWFTDETGTYFLAADGRAATGITAVGNDRFYFNELGARQDGFITAAGQLYFFNPLENGRMFTGWMDDGTNAYYFAPDTGYAATGFQTIDNDGYFFNEQHQRVAGLFDINGGKYYFNPLDGGKMARNAWVPTDQGTYYVGADGRNVTGLQTIDGQVYYFDASGLRQSGLINVNGVNNYFDPASGARVVGWIQTPQGLMYAIPENGSIVAGVAYTVDGALRIFNPQGIMMANVYFNYNGVNYAIDGNGIATPLPAGMPIPGAQAQAQVATATAKR